MDSSRVLLFQNLKLEFTAELHNRRLKFLNFVFGVLAFAHNTI